MWRRPQTVERIGNYAFLNHVPDPSSGTYRQVWQRGIVPDPGAQVFGWSTFLVPTVDPFPVGGRCGLPPDPRSGGAIFDNRIVQRVVPTPAAPNPVLGQGVTGFLALFGLAPAATQKTGG
jgi:hypothetical protein